MTARQELLEILLNIFITFDIYTLPLIIWRYIIKKRPIERSAAKKITIIYGIVAWFIMSLLLYIADEGVAGGSILLWSYINYRILISKSSDENKGEQKYIEIPPDEDPETVKERTERLADELYCQYIRRSDADLKMIIKSNSSEAAEIAAKRVLAQRDAQRRA